MKKSIKNLHLLVTILLITLFSCQQEETSISDLEGTVQFSGISLEFAPMGAPESRIMGNSSWAHIFPNSATIVLTNKGTNREYTLPFDPNDFSTPYPITLPFGSYEYQVNVEADVFMDFLPFEANGEFVHSNQNQEIKMKAETDFGLITVADKYVDNVVVSAGSKQSDLNILDEGTHYYKYVKGGTIATLRIIESIQKSTISKDIKVASSKHYNFVLKFNSTEITGIDLDPFELEDEEILVEFNSKFFEENGTIKCPGSTPGEKGFVNGKLYEAVDRALLIQRRNENADLSCVCTSLVKDMSKMFQRAGAFDQPIGSWDVSNVTNMREMFSGATIFNQPIGNWDVSKVTNMYLMFEATRIFNQPIGNWDVGKVLNMAKMFRSAIGFNQPIENWDVSNVTDMREMFSSAITFNQSIGNWNVSKVTNMREMFHRSRVFNQPIGSWDVSNVVNMSNLFSYAISFNQSIGDWNISKVTNMSRMFLEAKAFNQPIGNWDVSKVEDMEKMFYSAKSFNQSIEDWDVSKVTNMHNMFGFAISFNQSLNNWNTENVTNMSCMFSGATEFNKPIEKWNVSKVSDMSSMFLNANAFNQPIGNWDVNEVTNMMAMFSGATVFNQDLTGWCVQNINSQPSNFSSGSDLIQNNKPLWGTCPD